VDPEADEIFLDGGRVSAQGQRLYILLNKPAGYLVTASDPQGRPTVFDLLGKVRGRVFPVGRLDQDTEGLLLLTDDGELAHRLAHPRHGVIKGYWALLSGRVGEGELQKLLKGVRLQDGVACAKMAKLLSAGSDSSEIFLELITGKKRQVKRMCAAIDHPVLKLRRQTFADLSVEGMRCGQWRYLSETEVQRLKSIGS
jgi:pseudouridine synthase